MDEGTLKADYLVVGAGATGMAFVDTLLAESAASVVMVDRHHKPGGHWNDAYSFVRVHQPAAWYGLPSRELGELTRDVAGPNAGLYSLASGAEVLAHFDDGMQQRLLPSGRVQWLPMSEHRLESDGTHRVRSLVTGAERRVVARKVVDATHARTEVPSTHPPRYEIAPGVRCVPPNELPRIERPYATYAVIGCGKTGMDACLWLLENGVDPARIRWILPRDGWFMDRRNAQPGLENFELNMNATIGQFEAILEATSMADLLMRLERRGLLMRLDPDIEPSVYHCAIVSPGELEQLRAIGDKVRLGRVRRVEATRLVLERGSVPADPDTLYIDCTASAIQPIPELPVFDGDRINLFMVRWCQPVFSGSLIAWVECHVNDPSEKRALCSVVPSPFVPVDWLRMWAVTLQNTISWRQRPDLQEWLMRCRLNGNAVMMRGVKPDDAARMALVKDSGAKAVQALERIPALLATLDESRHAVV